MLCLIIYRKKRIDRYNVKNAENFAEKGKTAHEVTFENPMYEMNEIGDNGQVKGYVNSAYQTEEAAKKDSCL